MWFGSAAEATGANTTETARQARSLRGQVLFWFGCTLCIVIAGVCATLYLALLNQVNWVDDQILEKRLQTVRELLVTEVDRDYWLAHEVSEDMDGPRRTYVRIAWPAGETIIETPGMQATAPRGLFPEIGERSVQFASLSGAGDQRFRTLTARAPWAEGAARRDVVVQIATDTSLDDGALRSYRRILLVVTLLAIVLGLGFGAFWISRLLSPLERIANDIGAVDLDTLGKPIATTGLSQELLQLVTQHNAMVARLSTAYDGLRHYADNAAHELRTPLNRILLELEIALKQPRSDEEWRQAVSDAARDCRELTVLVDRLLFLARASSKQAGVQKQTLDLRKELGAIVAYFEAPAQEANVALELDIEGEVQLEADRVLFQRALTNIISNALSHTGAGGNIAVRGRRSAEFARIAISDTGSGIAAVDIPHVFNRFYRGDPSRSTSSGRVGLGLPIARAIVELHNGRISVESAPGKGTTVTLDLPLAPAAPATASALAASQ